ncbi:MAG: hypothetical protein DWP95_06785, partial [Proteobacteria bacterium]
LNPIRAGMATPLGESEFTSIKERIEAESTELLPFGKGDNNLPYYLSSYIDLVDETGRCVREDKRGFIATNASKILDQLGLDTDTWIDELEGFKSVGYSAIGTASQLKEFAANTKRSWALGLRLKPALE